MLSQHYRCRRRNAYGINRFRDFSPQNFTENSIDANALFPPTGGTRPPLSPVVGTDIGKQRPF